MMNPKTILRTSVSTALVASLLLLTACGLSSIAEVKSDPFRYQDRDARIGGVVRKSFGVLKFGVYEIEDPTGTMFVVSDHGVPAQGAKVEVKGRTMTAFQLAGVDYGTVLKESRRKIHR